MMKKLYKKQNTKSKPCSNRRKKRSNILPKEVQLYVWPCSEWKHLVSNPFWQDTTVFLFLCGRQAGKWKRGETKFPLGMPDSPSFLLLYPMGNHPFSSGRRNTNATGWQWNRTDPAMRPSWDEDAKKCQEALDRGKRIHRIARKFSWACPEEHHVAKGEERKSICTVNTISQSK